MTMPKAIHWRGAFGEWMPEDTPMMAIRWRGAFGEWMPKEHQKTPLISSKNYGIILSKDLEKLYAHYQTCIRIA